MQYFFVKGAGFHENGPQFSCNIGLLLFLSFVLSYPDKLFNESDEVFLEVMKNRFFSCLLLSFFHFFTLSLIFHGLRMRIPAQRLHLFVMICPVDECILI